MTHHVQYANSIIDIDRVAVAVFSEDELLLWLDPASLSTGVPDLTVDGEEAALVWQVLQRKASKAAAPKPPRAPKP